MSRFTSEEIEQAHNTDLVSFLQARNEELKKEGNTNYRWVHNGEAISINGNLWYNHYTQKGGEAIGFMKEFFGVDFKEAVSMLLGESYAQFLERDNPIVESKMKEFKLPERNSDMLKTFKYLTEVRGLSTKVVSSFIECGHIYESKEHHNAVFVGYSRSGEALHAHMHGTQEGNSFKKTCPGSDSKYSFHWHGTSNEIYLFESPIDMMSYITMFPEDWKNHSYAAACSVADHVLFQCIKDNPAINKVHICFDNDMAGQSAAMRLTAKLNEIGISTDTLVSHNKDWNEDLLDVGNGPILSFG